MRIAGASALVTGAGRGLGREFATALVRRGARVYAGVRDLDQLGDDTMTAVRLDVTDQAAIAASAGAHQDVSIVINNAGINTAGRPLTVSLDDVRRDLEVNYLGPLAVAQHFAPVLAANGGGVLVNVLSVYSWTTFPAISAYAASKAAAWSMTSALRQQLRGQGTRVLAVHMDSLDTDMTAGLDGPKHDPAAVVDAVLAAIESGQDEVLFDEYTRQVKAALSHNLPRSG
jgi:NAD(P)-dependent dehydrogenase (short-subunit alcohol dehydrogenase family)